jgi:hypothetical protein
METIGRQLASDVLTVALSSSIPAHLGGLSNFLLSQNNIVGVIRPDQRVHGAQLCHERHHQLTGTIPPEISGCVSLK